MLAFSAAYREAVPIYGSGGFTSYDDRQLGRQLAGWVEREGCRWVKMKIGTDPARDPARVATAKGGDRIRRACSSTPTAPIVASRRNTWPNVFAAEQDVRWFEEPVSSDDLAGLRQVREHAPAAMEIAAGEYGYTLDYFRRMLEAGAVDVLQADATRCGGVTGFLQAAALCEAYHTDLSAHCAPALHRHLGCAAPRFRHVEWFHDHARIEHMLFDGAPVPRGGEIAPDRSRPGLRPDVQAGTMPSDSPPDRWLDDDPRLHSRTRHPGSPSSVLAAMLSLGGRPRWHLLSRFVCLVARRRSIPAPPSAPPGG